MPDLLGAANPVPGYDKAVTNRNIPVSPEKVQIQNSPDLTKVMRGDRRTEQQGTDLQGDGKVRYDSNYQTFIQRLKETPDTLDSLVRIFSGKEGTTVLSGLQGGSAVEISQILNMLQMDEKQMLSFLLGQVKMGSRFQGALFALLRNAYAKADSSGVRSDILQFMKAYMDFSSSQHIEGNILRNLGDMMDAMPASWAEKLTDVMAQLQNAFAAGDRQGAMQILQKSIFPYISNYVEQTHDMGLPRDLVTRLALEAARYENGSSEKVLDAFHRLVSYGTLKTQLGGIDDQSLLMLLRGNQVDESSSAARFAEYLTQAAAKGLSGNDGVDAQEAFRNLVQAMLINESVYMPINHYLLPLQWDDRMLFSELWVDPDDESERRQSDQGGRAVKVLFKMDVQSLGLFDVILVSRDKTVDLQIFCPETVAPFSKQIEKGISDILVNNELVPARVEVRKMVKPVALTEVFPKIFEGKNSVDVKI